MPVLNHRTGPGTEHAGSNADADSRGVHVGLFSKGVFTQCANLSCRSGWMHLFRRRSLPIFEGGWTCSPACTEAMLLAAVRRERDGRGTAHPAGRHRIPLGLLMLEQGWITSRQLHDAVGAQKAAGTGRLGDWLVAQHATDEATVTRALGLQWSSPVLSVEPAGVGGLASLMPRLFLEAFGALPLRIAANQILYLGFEQSLDPVLSLAVGRMLGMRVEDAIVSSSAFQEVQRSMLAAEFPPVRLAEAVSESSAAQLLARCVERVQPVNARLIRVHDCLWLRMWLLNDARMVPDVGSVSDVICSIGPF